MSDYLAKLKRLCEGATEGEWWSHDPHPEMPVTVCALNCGEVGQFIEHPRIPREKQIANGKFIAESRQAIPWLVGMVEEMRRCFLDIEGNEIHPECCAIRLIGSVQCDCGTSDMLQRLANGPTPPAEAKAGSDQPGEGEKGGA